MSEHFREYRSPIRTFGKKRRHGLPVHRFYHAAFAPKRWNGTETALVLRYGDCRFFMDANCGKKKFESGAKQEGRSSFRKQDIFFWSNLDIYLKHLLELSLSLNNLVLAESHASKRSGCKQNHKQYKPWSVCSFSSSLIWVYSVCPDLYVQRLLQYGIAIKSTVRSLLPSLTAHQSDLGLQCLRRPVCTKTFTEHNSYKVNSEVFASLFNCTPVGLVSRLNEPCHEKTCQGLWPG